MHDVFSDEIVHEFRFRIKWIHVACLWV